MTKLQAIEKARNESKNGYVQHVCKRIEREYNAGGMMVARDYYYISDWCDESTIASYENGHEL